MLQLIAFPDVARKTTAALNSIIAQIYLQMGHVTFVVKQAIFHPLHLV